MCIALFRSRNESNDLRWGPWSCALAPTCPDFNGGNSSLLPKTEKVTKSRRINLSNQNGRIQQFEQQSRHI